MAVSPSLDGRRDDLDAKERCDLELCRVSTLSIVAYYPRVCGTSDRDTSVRKTKRANLGSCVVGDAQKTDRVAGERRVQKSYVAVVCGAPNLDALRAYAPTRAPAPLEERAALPAFAHFERRQSALRGRADLTVADEQLLATSWSVVKKCPEQRREFVEIADAERAAFRAKDDARRQPVGLAALDCRRRRAHPREGL